MKKKKKTELHVYDEEPFKTVCPERVSWAINNLLVHTS